MAQSARGRIRGEDLASRETLQRRAAGNEKGLESCRRGCRLKLLGKKRVCAEEQQVLLEGGVGRGGVVVWERSGQSRMQAGQ